ncbi:MAG TPA: EI24 domain-containing protein [Rhizomicrobium sp.]|nr:EI24 domain-containing protein [Rhizomicrobium sp.]
MFASLGRALATVFNPDFFGVIAKALILTLALFVAAFLALQWALHYLPTLHRPWLNGIVDVLASLGLLALFFIAGAPVAALFGSFFLDGIARSIEARFYPDDAPSEGAPVMASLVTALRFTGLVIAVTLALVPFDIALPGIGSATSLAADGWLLGRQYFELAALRHLSGSATDAMRRRHRFAILAGGILVSLLTYIPFADLIAPLFGVALMTHMFKYYQHRELAP